jgi:hypothetical protein
VDDAVPQVHEVHVIELAFGDLFVNGTEELFGRFINFDFAIEVVLDDGIEDAVLFWTEPAADFRYLIDPDSLILITRKGFFDFSVLFLKRTLVLRGLLKARSTSTGAIAGLCDHGNSNVNRQRGLPLENRPPVRHFQQ